MRILDIITKKRDNGELTRSEIEYFVEGCAKGDIPDYQSAALLMAVYFNGMTTDETVNLTRAMAESGDMVSLSHIEGVKVDKHSTGGVGDKTTLVVAPIVAACGVPVAKMSGRGLGHTGGTVDKLSSVPGLRTELSRNEFFEVVEKVGISVVGQSGNLAPADKKLYALRDVTGTVESIPMIAASIMSKKIAAGADAIVLDVKTGSGAFMSEKAQAIELARLMVMIGEGVGRRTVALITDMDTPLGSAVGNSLEVIEAVETLLGKGPCDLTELCIAIAAEMLTLAGKGSSEECKALATSVIESGAAFRKLLEMVEAQGGDTSVLTDTELFPKAAFKLEVKADRSGWITHMNAGEIGAASVILGAGRSRQEDSIDHASGIMIKAKTGQQVVAGEIIATLYTNNKQALEGAVQRYAGAITIQNSPSKGAKLIQARVSVQGVEEL